MHIKERFSYVEVGRYPQHDIWILVGTYSHHNTFIMQHTPLDDIKLVEIGFVFNLVRQSAAAMAPLLQSS